MKDQSHPLVLLGYPFNTNHRKLLIDKWAEELYRFYDHPSDPTKDFNDFSNNSPEIDG